MTGVMLSFGHGFSGQAISRALYVQGGWEVFGTTRSFEKFGTIVTSVAKPVIWPGADSLETLLDEATHLLISTAPNKDGDPVLNALSAAIKERRDQFEWVGYLSTTGVYGDHQGEWVDETTPLTPSTGRGKMRVAAEAAWAEMDLPLHIFRLAGIYGVGRGPFSKVRNGTARRIIKKNQLFSRIHAEDIARVVLASIAQPNLGSIYNVCDDFAAPPEDVIGYAAELLGVPVPEDEDFETAEMTPVARSFYSESKKVSNKKIKEELGVVLKYPDYKKGLKALLTDS